MRLAPGESVTLGRQAIPTDRHDAFGLNHYGGRGAIPTYSLVDVIKGQVPADRLAGRIVFIGVTALAAGDMFISPFVAELPGVEVLATAAGNIAHGQYLQRAPSTWAIDFIAAAILGILAFVAANQRSLAVAAAKALVAHSSLVAADIVREALKIAGEIDIYTNQQIVVEERACDQ